MAPSLRETAEAMSTLQADQMGDSSRAGSDGQTAEQSWEERGGAIGRPKQARLHQHHCAGPLQRRMPTAEHLQPSGCPEKSLAELIAGREANDPGQRPRNQNRS